MGHISKDCKESKANKVNCINNKIMLKNIKINEIEFMCLIDSGADISLIKESVFCKNFKKRNCTIQ